MKNKMGVFCSLIMCLLLGASCNSSKDNSNDTSRDTDSLYELQYIVPESDESSAKTEMNHQLLEGKFYYALSKGAIISFQCENMSYTDMTFNEYFNYYMGKYALDDERVEGSESFSDVTINGHRWLECYLEVVGNDGEPRHSEYLITKNKERFYVVTFHLNGLKKGYSGEELGEEIDVVKNSLTFI